MIDFLITRFDPSDLIKITAKMHCLKLRLPLFIGKRLFTTQCYVFSIANFLNHFRLHITKSVKGKMWSDMGFFSIRKIQKFRFGSPQIFMVKLLILHNFRCSQAYPFSRRNPAVKFHPSGQILSEIHNRISRRRMKNLFYGKDFFRLDRKAISIENFSAFFRTFL